MGIAVHVSSATTREREGRPYNPKVEIFFDGGDYLPPDKVEEIFGLESMDRILVSERPHKEIFVSLLEELGYEYYDDPERRESRLLLPLKGILTANVGKALEQHRKETDPKHPVKASSINGFNAFVDFVRSNSSRPGPS